MFDSESVEGIRNRILCSVVVVVIAVRTTTIPVQSRSGLGLQVCQHQRLTLVEGGSLNSMRHLRKQEFLRQRAVEKRLTSTSQKGSEQHRFGSPVVVVVVAAAAVAVAGVA